MSTTIDSLDIQIKTSAGQAEQNIDKLAVALGKLRENAKLTTVVNNLDRLKNTLSDFRVSSDAVSNIKSLSKAMSSLQSLKGLNGFSSAVRAMGKIPDITRKLDSATIEQFSKKIERLVSALEPLAARITTISSGFSRLPSHISRAATATARMATATDDASGALNTNSVNLMAAISNFKELYHAVQTTIQTISNFMAQAIEWDGIQFRFGRAFGEDAEETYAYVQKINDALGINIQEFMQYSSLYGSLLNGFGMAQDKVTAISLGLTELSYDIWAAYNDRFKTLEDASEAVRSAITGEIEPIRNAGIALTEASLQEYIDSTHLAGVSIEKLTEAQKSEVRYAAMVNAAMNQGIVGTYAREMNTAEGAVRSMSQSFKGLVQALGSLFIPLLQKIVPYLTAFIELVTEAVFWVASLFNIPIQEIDWGSTASGIGGVADSAKDTATGLDSAAKAAKKLKSYTMGFDELNVIDPNKDSGSGGGSGGGGASGWGEGLDLEKLWNNSVFDEASRKVDEIKQKIKDFFSTWGVELALIGAAILGWKISTAFIKGLQLVSFALKAIGGSETALVALQMLRSEKMASGVLALRNVLLKTPIGALILGSGSTSIGAAALAVGAVLASVMALVGGFVLVFKESENFREGLLAIGKGVLLLFDKIGDAISWIVKKVAELAKTLKTKLKNVIPDGVVEFFEKLDFGIGDLLITAGGLALFGPAGLAIEGAVAAIKLLGYAAKDSMKPVELFGDGISEATREKVEPFIEKMSELEDTLAELDWGNAIVDEDDLKDISSKLKTITSTIVNELDSDKNEALAKLNPLREALSEEKFNSIVKKVEDSYSGQVKAVEEGETRINTILKKASDEARALTDEEAAEIEKIQREMKETGVKYLSESETESNLILKRLKDNASKLSAEQASNVIKSALEAKNKTVKSAEEQYKGILLEAQRLLDTGAINEEEYAEIVKAAEDARDETVTAAENQYKDILDTAKSKMGEYSKYIDEETGEIKSNWEVFCDDFSKKAKDMWGDLKTWFKDNVAPKFTKAYWEDKFKTISEAASKKLGEAEKVIKDKWNSVKTWFNENVKSKFTSEYWKAKFDPIRSSIKTKLDDAWKEVKEFFSVSAWKKKVEDAVKAIKDNFKMPEFPKIKITVTFNTDIGPVEKAVYNALGLEGRPSLKWTAYAMGGMPSMGEMFIAREAGPELVGRIGNKSAVVNNDQIVAAVSQGVYTAVVSAMSGGGNGGQAVNVYLDGKQIYASVKKAEAQRGVTLLGNQLEYGY